LLRYQYKYNGKELQDELGLNMYDYGSRLYDPARAGWSNIDPLAEKMRRYSPYNYCFDNPLRFTDPDGMKPMDIIIKGSPSYQKTVLRDMQRLTNDKLVMVGDQVKIESKGTENSGSVLTTGTNVVAEMINSPKTAEIRSSPDINFTTPKDLSADGKNSNAFGTTEKPGKGADSTIGYNPKNTGEGIVNDNEACSTGRPAEIGLGHELPHALNNANGTSDQTVNPTIVDPDTGQKGVLKNEEISVRKVDNLIRGEQGVTLRPIPQ
jgi:RHS repeat-associated protein